MQEPWQSSGKTLRSSVFRVITYGGVQLHSTLVIARAKNGNGKIHLSQVEIEP